MINSLTLQTKQLTSVAIPHQCVSCNTSAGRKKPVDDDSTKFPSPTHLSCLDRQVTF